MGKARWWVCGACKSLNDLPAEKCYHCRTKKPDEPTLMDDQYSQVGGETKRVGVSVDRALVSELTAPDPIERAPGGSLMERLDFGAKPPEQAGPGQAAAPGPAAAARPPAEVRPLREPEPRGIGALGGLDWSDGLPPLPEEWPAEDDLRASDHGTNADPLEDARG